MLSLYSLIIGKLHGKKRAFALTLQLLTMNALAENTLSLPLYEDKDNTQKNLALTFTSF